MVVYYPDNSAAGVSLAGSKLVLPSLTLGNVGQLAVDLFISTLSATRVGFIEDDYIVPMAGNDTFTINQGKLSTAIEVNTKVKLVFLHAQSKTTFVQIRSPTAKGYNQLFAKGLMEWASATGFTEVVVLASVDASYRHDVQLIGQQLRYHAKGVNAEALNTLGFLPLEEKSFPLLLKKGSLTEGFKSIVVLAIFCYEGDNIPESIQLTEAANQYLKLVDSSEGKWRPPNSWTLIQGGPFETSLFQ